MLKRSKKLDVTNDRLLWSSKTIYTLMALSGQLLWYTFARHILEHDPSTCPAPHSAAWADNFPAVVTLFSLSAILRRGYSWDMFGAVTLKTFHYCSAVLCHLTIWATATWRSLALKALHFFSGCGFWWFEQCLFGSLEVLDSAGETLILWTAVGLVFVRWGLSTFTEDLKWLKLGSFFFLPHSTAGKEFKWWKLSPVFF